MTKDQTRDLFTRHLRGLVRLIETGAASPVSLDANTAGLGMPDEEPSRASVTMVVVHGHVLHRIHAEAGSSAALLDAAREADLTATLREIAAAALGCPLHDVPEEVSPAKALEIVRAQLAQRDKAHADALASRDEAHDGRRRGFADLLGLPADAPWKELQRRLQKEVRGRELAHEWRARAERAEARADRVRDALDTCEEQLASTRATNAAVRTALGIDDDADPCEELEDRVAVSRDHFTDLTTRLDALRDERKAICERLGIGEGDDPLERIEALQLEAEDAASEQAALAQVTIDEIAAERDALRAEVEAMRAPVVVGRELSARLGAIADERARAERAEAEVERLKACTSAAENRLADAVDRGVAVSRHLEARAVRAEAKVSALDAADARDIAAKARQALAAACAHLCIHVDKDASAAEMAKALQEPGDAVDRARSTFLALYRSEPDDDLSTIDTIAEEVSRLVVNLRGELEEVGERALLQAQALEEVARRLGGEGGDPVGLAGAAAEDREHLKAEVERLRTKVANLGAGLTDWREWAAGLVKALDGKPLSDAEAGGLISGALTDAAARARRVAQVESERDKYWAEADSLGRIARWIDRYVGRKDSEPYEDVLQRWADARMTKAEHHNAVSEWEDVLASERAEVSAMAGRLAAVLVLLGWDRQGEESVTDAEAIAGRLFADVSEARRLLMGITTQAGEPSLLALAREMVEAEQHRERYSLASEILATEAQVEAVKLRATLLNAARLVSCDGDDHGALLARVADVVAQAEGAAQNGRDLAHAEQRLSDAERIVARLYAQAKLYHRLLADHLMAPYEAAAREAGDEAARKPMEAAK